MGKRIVVIGLLVLLPVSIVVEAQTWYRGHGQVGWASGTKALVTNLETGQQVNITINDRGPFVDPERRIIDLSRAAAGRIGLVQRGVGRVHVVPVQEVRRIPPQVLPSSIAWAS
jgi:rare lipoprotein A (RlpA)-like double-psi beta-barrel protein